MARLCSQTKFVALIKYVMKITAAAVACIGIGVSLPSCAFAAAEVAHTFSSGLRLITVSADYSRAGLDLAGELGYDHPLLAVYTPATRSYVLTPMPPADHLIPGQGYWVKFPSNGPFGLSSAGQEPDRSQAFTIPLAAGWNMIGDPFQVPVRVSALSMIDARSGQTFLR